MRGFLGVFLVYLSSFTVCAQQHYIDSLESLLPDEKETIDRIRILCELSDKYLAFQPPKAKQYAQEALALSKKLNYKPGEALALNRLGEHEFRQSNYAVAMEITTESLRIAEEIEDSTYMAMAYRVLGNINNIGLKRYDSALQYQLKAFRIHESRRDLEKMASLCGSITWIYAKTGNNLEEGLALANLGIHLSDSLKHNQFLSYNYNSKGMIYMSLGKLDSALKYLSRSIEVAETTQDFTVIAYNKNIMADVFLLQHDVQQAMRFYEMALDESRELNQREVLKNAYEGLAKCHEAMGNYALAYKYHLKHTALKDSLLNIEIAQKALMAELEFEKAKKETKIIELQAEANQAQKEKTIYVILFISGFLFMITVVILIVRNNRHRTKSNLLLKEKNDEIEEQNAMLQQANQTKDKLFSIIGHDLRSPLVSLKGMLGMVVRNEVSDQEFKQFAPKLNRQVIGINETLENLLQWSTQNNGWSTTLTTFYLFDLINKCTQLFDEPAQEKNIILDNQVDHSIQAQGNPDQIELIFRNLVHNAIKFTPERGRVSIQTRKEDGFAVISVADTGIGMSDEQQENLFRDDSTLTTRGTLGERGTGLGFNLCREMATQNGGRIEVLSEEGKGSTFQVFLPLSRP